MCLLSLNAAFVKSTNPCLCQPNPQPELSKVAVENGQGGSNTKEILTHWYTKHFENIPSSDINVYG
jgi:hypothetical protein